MNTYHKLLIKRDLLLFNNAFDFFCKELGISDEESKIISLNIVSKLESKSSSGNCVGRYVFNELHKITIKIAEYGSIVGMIDVLAHELVHAKQNLRNEFKFIEIEEPYLYFFKRKVTKRVHAGQILESTPYYEQICEQEAFNLAYTMTTKYMNTIYNKSVKGENE